MDKLDSGSLEVLRYLVSNVEQNSTVLATMVMTRYSEKIKECIRIVRLLRNKGFVDCFIDDEKFDLTMLSVTHEGLIYENSCIEESKSEKIRSRKQKVWEITLIAISAIVSLIVSFLTTLWTNSTFVSKGV